MKYIVISSLDMGELADRVDDKIAIGWEPQGGVCVVASVHAAQHAHDVNGGFYQAMVRHQPMVKRPQEAGS